MIAWALLLAPAGLLAAGPVQRTATFYTSRAPRISITNLSGIVVVRGWDKSQVRAVYLMASPRIEIDAEQMPPQGEANKIELATHFLDRGLQGSNASVNYTLDVPMGSYLEIRNYQGAIHINRLNGDAWLESAGANIAINDATGEIEARSVGGQIEIIHPAGSVEATSFTGDLQFMNPTSSRIHASTTSGKILYEGNLNPNGEYVLSSYSGDISFLCPSSASFELSARSVHGTLIDAMKATRHRRRHTISSYGNALFGVHNEGAATVELTSFSGTIRISPQPQPQQ